MVEGGGGVKNWVPNYLTFGKVGNEKKKIVTILEEVQNLRAGTAL